MVGAYGWQLAVGVVALLCEAAARSDDYLFGSLSLPQLEALVAKGSLVVKVKMAPRSMRHGGASHDAVVHKARVEDGQTRGAMAVSGKLLALQQTGCFAAKSEDDLYG